MEINGNKIRLVAFAVVVFVAYGLMFFDGRFKVWLAFGLDYSTHTAVAIGLVTLLIFNAPRLTILWISSLTGYVLLMLHQQYHTVSDIVTTGIVVSIPIALVLTYLNAHLQCAKNGTQG